MIKIEIDAFYDFLRVKFYKNNEWVKNSCYLWDFNNTLIISLCFDLL